MFEFLKRKKRIVKGHHKEEPKPIDPEQFKPKQLSEDKYKLYAGISITEAKNKKLTNEK